MPARPRSAALGLALAFVLAAGVAPARAGFNATVTGITGPASGGLTQYSYTVTDLASSTANVGEFSLIVAYDANLTAFSAPTGYLVDYTAGNTSVAFESTDPMYDLTPGNSETFSFLSPDKPLQLGYTLLDYNTFGTTGGTIVSPGVIPEPASLVLLGVGLLLAVGMLARRGPLRLAGPPVRPA